MMRSLRRRLVFASVLIAFVIGPAALCAGRLTVDAIDVGQGDALLLTDGQGGAVLIDAGNSYLGAGPKVERHLALRGVERLSAIVITHAHVDHYGGITHLLERVKIDQVLYGTRVHTPMYEELERAIRAKGIPYRHVRTGDTLPLGAGVDARVLHAAQEELPAGVQISDLCDDGDGTEGVDLNLFSVVVRARLGSRSILCTGDAPGKLEDAMVAAHAIRADDVLKVSHHGSAHSSTAGFLGAVRPAHALISCGTGNDYGHPTADCLERLGKVSAKVHRTDRGGTLVMTTDGRTLQVGPLVEAQQLFRQSVRASLFELLDVP